MKVIQKIFVWIAFLTALSFIASQKCRLDLQIIDFGTDAIDQRFDLQKRMKNWRETFRFSKKLEKLSTSDRTYNRLARLLNDSTQKLIHLIESSSTSPQKSMLDNLSWQSRESFATSKRIVGNTFTSFNPFKCGWSRGQGKRSACLARLFDYPSHLLSFKTSNKSSDSMLGWIIKFFNYVQRFQFSFFRPKLYLCV